MENLLQEMLVCELLLMCETHGCNAMFEPEEPPHDPIEAWSVRAAAAAESLGWTIGHTGLVKCPTCASAQKKG
jgi:hypothetical protein